MTGNVGLPPVGQDRRHGGRHTAATGHPGQHADLWLAATDAMAGDEKMDEREAEKESEWLAEREE